MMLKPIEYDAVVVGAGPNGLAAAITIAQEGRSVLILEARETIGGGARSAELTLPGFVHDICSAIHPLAIGSPFFRSIPLSEHGLEIVHPALPLAHPLDDGSAVILDRSVAATAAGLGRDSRRYARLMDPLVADSDKLAREFLGPLRVPRHPVAMAQLGLRSLRSAVGLARRFDEEPARALIAGLAAHSMLRLDQFPSGAFALALGLFAHSVGWPAARGGSQTISDALASYLRSLGGEIRTNTEVVHIDDLPAARAYLFDVTPSQLLRIAGDRLPDRYRHRLGRYRYGPGVFKVDWALDGPVPWEADACRRAGTVHVGGTIEEIARAEDEATSGVVPEKPFVLVAQQSIFDATRAPADKHTLWAYCHVPSGCAVDMTDRIEDQIELYAPGFRDIVLARAVKSPADLESYNPNYVGGDINGGLQDFGQLFTRPVARLNPYTTPARDIFICSSSTPPGGGVHGMCGAWAARAALRRAL
jgi:phytoene dehydrogenase-like protein